MEDEFNLNENSNSNLKDNEDIKKNLTLNDYLSSNNVVTPSPVNYVNKQSSSSSKPKIKLTHEMVNFYFNSKKKNIPTQRQIILGLIILLIPGVVLYLLKLRNTKYNSQIPADSEIDEYVSSHVEICKREILGDATRYHMDDLSSLVLDFYVKGESQLNNEMLVKSYPIIKVGDDLRIRSTEYSYNLLTLISKKIVLIRYNFSLTSSRYYQSCEEHFYKAVDYITYDISNNGANLSFGIVKPSGKDYAFKFEFPIDLSEKIKLFVTNLNNSSQSTDYKE